MSRINEKLGLKPAGKRRRTHPEHDQKHAIKCETCGQRWLVQIQGQARALCGFCGAVQDLTL